MTMNNIEVKAVIEAERIKAKTAITVAVLNNATSTSLSGLSNESKQRLLQFINDLHKQIED